MMSVKSVRPNNFAQQLGKRSSLPYSGQCAEQAGRPRTAATFFLLRGNQMKEGRNKRLKEKCIWNPDQTMSEASATLGLFRNH